MGRGGGKMGRVSCGRGSKFVRLEKIGSQWPNLVPEPT